VQLPVMPAAERDGEFITDFQPDGSRLRKAQVMRVRRLSSAYETWLRGNELQVSLATEPSWFSEDEGASRVLLPAAPDQVGVTLEELFELSERPKPYARI
jgi:hypothetical protein